MEVDNGSSRGAWLIPPRMLILDAIARFRCTLLFIVLIFISDAMYGYGVHMPLRRRMGRNVLENVRQL